MLLCAIWPPFPCAGIEPPSPPYTIESARNHLQYLKEEEGRVEKWVEEQCEKEFAARLPGLDRGPRRPKEKAAAFKEREMRARMALSGVRESLRKERKEGLLNERKALLSTEIREMLPARLGPYDVDREEYPLLLGFGWPAGLSVKFMVPEKFRGIFELRLIGKIPAWFRLNERGEAFLLSLGRFWKETDPVRTRINVIPPGPRLVWQGSHDSWVTSVAFRPDGAEVLSAGADGTLCVWDAATGNRVFLLDNVEIALSVAYSPDGRTFATGGADSFMRMRDAENGRELWRASADGRILSVAFGPDGRYVAVGDGSGMVRVWNVQSRKEVSKADLKAPVWSVAFTRSGTAFVAGGEANAVVLWNLLYDRQTWRKEFDWPVYSVASGSDRALVAVGGGGPRVVVLQEKDGSVVWSADMGGEIRSLRFDPPGNLLAGGGSGYNAKVFAADTGRQRWAAEIGNPIRSVDFGPGGTKLAVGSSDFSVRVFEVAEEERVVAAFGSAGRIYLERGGEQSLFRP
jgi:WD40 repeat protein